MKDFKKFFAKTSVLIVVVSVFTILIVGLVVAFLIFPTFSTYLSTRSENTGLNKEISTIEKNIQMARDADTKEINKLAGVINKFIPEEEDLLRMLTLSEVVARASGVGIQSVSLDAVSETPSAPTTQQGVPGGSEQTPNPSPAPAPSSPAASDSYSLTLDLSGSFNSVMTFIINYQKLDRLAGISEISINGEGETLSTAVKLVLPLSETFDTASPTDELTIAEQEKEIIQEVIRNAQFSAAPSKSPLGKANPFE